MGKGQEREKRVRVKNGVRNTYVPLIEGESLPEDKPADISGVMADLDRLNRSKHPEDLRGRLRGEKVRSV